VKYSYLIENNIVKKLLHLVDSCYSTSAVRLPQPHLSPIRSLSRKRGDFPVGKLR